MTLENRVRRLEHLLGIGKEIRTGPVVDLLIRVAAAYHVTPAQIVEHKKTMEIVATRHAFCWLARRAGYTCQAIGRVIARDHGAVLYAAASIEDQMDTVPEFRAHIHQLAAQVGVKLKEAA
jgi:chromosomal replication initiation ATPase DnaA